MESAYTGYEGTLKYLSSRKKGLDFAKRIYEDRKKKYIDDPHSDESKRDIADAQDMINVAEEGIVTAEKDVAKALKHYGDTKLIYAGAEAEYGKYERAA